MGSFWGHVVPGVSNLIFWLWWMLRVFFPNVLDLHRPKHRKGGLVNGHSGRSGVIRQLDHTHQVHGRQQEEVELLVSMPLVGGDEQDDRSVRRKKKRALKTKKKKKKKRTHRTGSSFMFDDDVETAYGPEAVMMTPQGHDSGSDDDEGVMDDDSESESDSYGDYRSRLFDARQRPVVCAGSACGRAVVAFLRFEPYFRVAFALFGVAVELLVDDRAALEMSIDETHWVVGHVVHVGLYSLYALTGVIQIASQFPKCCFSRQVGMMSVGLLLLYEGVVFWFHSQHQPRVEAELHKYLSMFAVTAAPFALLDSPSLPLHIRLLGPALACAHGTWWFEIAVAFYMQKWPDNEARVMLASAHALFHLTIAVAVTYLLASLMWRFGYIVATHKGVRKRRRRGRY